MSSLTITSQAPPEPIAPQLICGEGICDVWTSTGRFALAFAALLCVMFPDVIFGGKVFVFRDFGLFGYPLAHHYRESLLGGELPLWNPLNCSGTPFLAQWNTMVLYPPSLMHLVVPMPWSLTWFCLLHQFFGALGMYCLTRRWTGSGLAAAVAGVAFGFGGLTLSALIWPNNIAALGWLPWVLLATERAWQEGRSRVVQAAGVGAMQMLTGAPEIILFTWALVGLLWIAAASFARSQLTRHVARVLGVAGLVGGLSAVQLMPFMDLLRHSQRFTATLASSECSLPAWGWANLLVPLFRCVESSAGVFLQPQQFWVSSYYPGVTILALGIFALWRPRVARLWPLAALVLAGLVLALGDHSGLYSWLRHVVPGLNLIRFPVKFMVLVAIALPLLAAFAIAKFDSDRVGKTWKPLLYIAALLALGIGVVLIVDRLEPLPETDTAATLRCGLERIGFLGLTLCALLWRARSTSVRTRTLLSAGLPVLLWLDFLTHVPRQNPTVDAAAYRLRLPPLLAMQPTPEHGESRVMLTRGAIAKFTETLVSNPFDGYLGNRLGLSFNCNMVEGFPKLDGFFSLYLPHESEVRWALLSHTNQLPNGLLDFLGVGQITAPGSYLQWQARSTWMPMVSAGQTPIIADESSTLLGLTDPGFDPRRVVFLSPQSGLTSGVSPGSAEIVSTEISAHQVRAEVQATAPSLVVIAQTYYHRWRATVDGQPVPLWRANHAFQAVEVPPGHHVVELRYVDAPFRWGAGVSATALCAVGLLILRFRRTNGASRLQVRQQPTSPAPP